MDLSTTYMGLELKNPIIVSSSRLTSDIKNVIACAENGAGAIILKSLFEEQLLADTGKLMDQDDQYFWYPEAVDYLNSHAREQGFAEYISLIQEAKEATKVPIIASINCVTAKEWPKFAAKLEEAGADGLELNISIMPFDENLSSQELEKKYIEIVSEVKRYVNIPVAVKIGCMFTNLISLVKGFEEAKADGVVLFNRFFQPDIDIENERVVMGEVFSNPEEMTQSLRWISLLSGHVKPDLAANTGIHTAEGLIKQLLAGAAATQICTTLYINGIDYIQVLLSDLESWAKARNYSSLSQFQGKLSKVQENTAAFARVQYLKKTLTGK
jgi:dihydroorotate dehydrogenase (fumarate)